MDRNVDITIPVLNEEKTLFKQIEKMVTYIEETNLINVRLIIADNGSTDNTQVIGLELQRKYPSLVSYLRVSKRGVGLALKESWNKSNADIVGYMDLDLSTDISHLGEVSKLFEKFGNDIHALYGSRLHSDSIVIGRTLKRELSSRTFNFILKNYFGSNISDGMCGFKFFHRKTFISVFSSYNSWSDGWFFCSEITLALENKKFHLYELPVKWSDDEASKVNIMTLSIEYLKAMKKLKSSEIFRNNP